MGTDSQPTLAALPTALSSCGLTGGPFYSISPGTWLSSSLGPASEFLTVRDSGKIVALPSSQQGQTRSPLEEEETLTSLLPPVASRWPDFTNPS